MLEGSMKIYTRRTALTIGSSLLLAGLSTRSFGFSLPGSSSGGGGVLSGVVGLLTSDPLFNNRSIGEVYVATSRVIHLTTNEIGKGIFSAVKALEIKTEKDIPAYLNDLDAVEMPNSFTGQVKERDAEIIEFASEASVQIKEKLESGFSLSDEAKLELGKAHTSVGVSEVFQGKAAKGGIKFGADFVAAGDMMSVALKLKDALKLDLDIDAFFKALGGFATDVSDLFSNVGGIYEVKEAIEKAEDMSGVELAKAEFLEESANSTIDSSVANDLEKFAT